MGALVTRAHKRVEGQIPIGKTVDPTNPSLGMLSRHLDADVKRPPSHDANGAVDEFVDDVGRV